MGIAGRLVVLNLRLRIARVNQGFLETNFIRVVTLGPVISVVAQRDNGLCRIKLSHPFRQTLFVPGLRANRPVILVGVVLVVGHQDQIIGGRRVVLVIPGIVVERHRLRQHPTARLELFVQLLDEFQKIRLRLGQRFLEVETDAGELVLLDKGADRIDQSLSRRLIGNRISEKFFLPRLVRQVLHHRNDREVRPFLANQVECFNCLRIVEFIRQRTLAGFGVDQMRPLRHDPIKTIQISFERRETGFVPINVETDRYLFRPEAGGCRQRRTCRRRRHGKEFNMTSRHHARLHHTPAVGEPDLLLQLTGAQHLQQTPLARGVQEAHRQLLGGDPEEVPGRLVGGVDEVLLVHQERHHGSLLDQVLKGIRRMMRGLLGPLAPPRPDHGARV